MTRHEVNVRHLRDGFLRWAWRCSCGVGGKAHGQGEAGDAALDHVQDTAGDDPDCTCYDPRSLEHDPAGPCRTCREAS